MEELKKQKEEKRRSGRSVGRWLLKWVTALLLFLVVLFLVGALIFCIYVEKNVSKTIDESLFSIVGSDSATTLYYYEETESGERRAVAMDEGALYGGYRSIYVDYGEIPEDLINAFVSIEDKRFWEHRGVDWRRTLSAGANYFLKFSGSYGGSTITQQLIKNVTDEDEYSFQRKTQEIFWALDLETKMDKKEILGLYLNVINLSQGCYGVQAASEYYFSKDVSELSLNECACIAAITNSPSYYDPLQNPENNRARRRLILREMYAQGYISEEELNDALSEGIVLNIEEESSYEAINSWYVDMVIEDVMRDLMKEYGYSRPMANLVLYTGGLKIYTEMDPKIQSILEEYYAKTSHFYTLGAEVTPQSSMIVLDAERGGILGVVGGVGEKRANRIQNFATQTLRPAGSVVKPLSVYAPALEYGHLLWSTVYDDVPVNFGKYNLDPEKGKIIQPVAWPKNSTGIYRGLTNVNYALAHSVNTVTVRALEELGVENSFEFLYESLGMKSLIREGSTASGSYITDMDVAALALGQMNYGVTVKEITAAYSVFPTQGIYHEARSYEQVTDGQGSILLERKYHGEAVLSEGNADVMNRMLENVVQEGTATSISLKSKIACAGKTGTTQNNYDRWYIGYTPKVIGGVWYGYEYPKSLSGSNQCLSIWDEVMTEIHEQKGWLDEKQEFRRSEEVMEAEYCVDSGKLPTEVCQRDPRGNRIEKGYFVRGTEPTGFCTCHVPVLYDKAEGGIAFEGECEKAEYVGLISVVRSFPCEVTVSDAQYVWREIGKNVLPETSPTLPFFHNLLGEGEYCGISKADAQYNRFCRTHFNYFEWKRRQEE
ncbi:MAG: transglycosylase domain-containing protein [Clostridia bacterium]|nr:transglycosylase domain-containing protein [Clostridia bacterium]